MRTKVCLFLRVSTDKQDTERQKNDLLDFAEKRNWEVVEIIQEKISGAKTNEERKGIQELIKKAKSGKFQKIIVTELSRLGRNAFQVQSLIEQMKNLKISIVIQSLNNGLETLDENGNQNEMTNLMIAIVNQFSQMERQFLRDRIKSKLDQLKKSGVKLGRKEGTTESTEDFLKKYNHITPDIWKGLSVRKLCKLHDVSIGTVQKIKASLKE